MGELQEPPVAIVKRPTEQGARYQVRVRDAYGNWLPSHSFDALSDAQTYERSAHADAKSGTSAATATRREMTFARHWRFWTRTRGGRNPSESWIESQDQMARDYLLPHLGGLLLKEIRRHNVERILVDLAENGRSAATVDWCLICFGPCSPMQSRRELLTGVQYRMTCVPSLPTRSRRISIRSEHGSY